jgi:hypothetical protein
MNAAAAVVDLETYRRSRANAPAPRRAPARPLVPVWYVWMPVWPVA